MRRRGVKIVCGIVVLIVGTLWSAALASAQGRAPTTWDFGAWGHRGWNPLDITLGSYTTVWGPDGTPTPLPLASLSNQECGHVRLLVSPLHSDDVDDEEFIRHLMVLPWTVARIPPVPPYDTQYDPAGIYMPPAPPGEPAGVASTFYARDHNVALPANVWLWIPPGTPLGTYHGQAIAYENQNPLVTPPQLDPGEPTLPNPVTLKVKVREEKVPYYAFDQASGEPDRTNPANVDTNASETTPTIFLDWTGDPVVDPVVRIAFSTNRNTSAMYTEAWDLYLSTLVHDDLDDPPGTRPFLSPSPAVMVSPAPDRLATITGVPDASLPYLVAYQNVNPSVSGLPGDRYLLWQINTVWSDQTVADWSPGAQAGFFSYLAWVYEPDSSGWTDFSTVYVLPEGNPGQAKSSPRMFVDAADNKWVFYYAQEGQRRDLRYLVFDDGAGEWRGGPLYQVGRATPMGSYSRALDYEKDPFVFADEWWDAVDTTVIAPDPNDNGLPTGDGVPELDNGVQAVCSVLFSGFLSYPAPTWVTGQAMGQEDLFFTRYDPGVLFNPGYSPASDTGQVPFPRREEMLVPLQEFTYQDATLGTAYPVYRASGLDWTITGGPLDEAGNPVNVPQIAFDYNAVAGAPYVLPGAPGWTVSSGGLLTAPDPRDGTGTALVTVDPALGTVTFDQNFPADPGRPVWACYRPRTLRLTDSPLNDSAPVVVQDVLKPVNRLGNTVAPARSRLGLLWQRRKGDEQPTLWMRSLSAFRGTGTFTYLEDFDFNGYPLPTTVPHNTTYNDGYQDVAESLVPAETIVNETALAAFPERHWDSALKDWDGLKRWWLVWSSSRGLGQAAVTLPPQADWDLYLATVSPRTMPTWAEETGGWGDMYEP